MCYSQRVLNNFQEIAKEYDQNIALSIPYYGEMIESMIHLIPFQRNDHFRVIDLGCGTGTLAFTIKQKFPNAEITCMDLCENMLERAISKLKPYHDIHFELDDFYTYQFGEKYDVIFSTLSLHYLSSDEEKRVFYNKIYNGLNYGGVFYNGDLVSSRTPKQQQVYTQKWRQYILKNMTSPYLLDEFLPQQQTTDAAAPLMKQIEWLEEIGFQNVDVVWKHYNMGLFGGMKGSLH